MIFTEEDIEIRPKQKKELQGREGAGYLWGWQFLRWRSGSRPPPEY
jgi:hypothetical protein